MESTHEEQVWKSHLNYFDEVKPTDIDRELLLTIVNGGNVELNPKNKKAYNHLVNTNNIFTSNDQINLMQRRVSIIKFGNRLNGRPLGEGTLKEINELKPEREKTYTKFTPQEDGSLLAEECSCADIDNENEYKIDEEDYWSGYKTSYEQNMKIRNEKLGQLFHELGKLPEGRTANEPETSQNEVVQDKCVLPSNDDEDYIPF